MKSRKKVQSLIINYQLSCRRLTESIYSHSRLKMDQSQGRLVNFRLLYLITQLIGVALVILVISWIGLHLKGFGWDYEEPKIMFNWHPLLMVFIEIFLAINNWIKFELQYILTDTGNGVFVWKLWVHLNILFINLMIKFLINFRLLHSHSRVSRLPLWT